MSSSSNRSSSSPVSSPILVSNMTTINSTLNPSNAIPVNQQKGPQQQQSFVNESVNSAIISSSSPSRPSPINSRLRKRIDTLLVQWITGESMSPPQTTNSHMNNPLLFHQKSPLKTRQNDHHQLQQQIHRNHHHLVEGKEDRHHHEDDDIIIQEDNSDHYSACGNEENDEHDIDVEMVTTHDILSEMEAEEKAAAANSMEDEYDAHSQILIQTKPILNAQIKKDSGIDLWKDNEVQETQNELLPPSSSSSTSLTQHLQVEHVLHSPSSDQHQTIISMDTVMTEDITTNNTTSFNNTAITSIHTPNIRSLSELHQPAAKKEKLDIPQFFFPRGKPLSRDEERTQRHSLLKTVYPLFLNTSHYEESKNEKDETQKPDEHYRSSSSQNHHPSMRQRTSMSSLPSLSNLKNSSQSPQNQNHGQSNKSFSTNTPPQPPHHTVTASFLSTQHHRKSMVFHSQQSLSHQLEVYKMGEREFVKVTKKLAFPRYLNKSLFRKVMTMDASASMVGGVGLKGGEDANPVGYTEKSKITFRQFAKCWKILSQDNHDINALTFSILCQDGRDYMNLQDMELVVQDVVQHHPGLAFLQHMPIFQQRYVETVATRIFIQKSRGWNERMTLPEFKRMEMLSLLRQLDENPDINQARNSFSYKHFYVIYCKFWELDTDHDLLLSAEDLYRYDNGGLLWRVVDRCVEGAGLPRIRHGMTSSLATSTGKQQHQLEVVPGSGMMTVPDASFVTQEKKMTYREFVHFILAVEDKSLPSSIEYWFRVLDMDSDGMISLYELQWFWEEHFERMYETRSSDFAKFHDFICSIMDVVQPKQGNIIKLSDLKKCSHPGLVLDMIFDIGKYDIRMRRIDPVSRELDQVWVLDGSFQRIKLEGWEKFAERTYEILAIEESQGNNHHRTDDGNQQDQHQEEEEVVTMDSDTKYECYKSSRHEEPHPHKIEDIQLVVAAAAEQEDNRIHVFQDRYHHLHPEQGNGEMHGQTNNHQNQNNMIMTMLENKESLRLVEKVDLTNVLMVKSPSSTSSATTNTSSFFKLEQQQNLDLNTAVVWMANNRSLMQDIDD